MAEDQAGEKTEEPTEKRRREFREKGQVAQSREVHTAMLFSGGLLIWSLFGPAFWGNLQEFLAFFFRTAGEIPVRPDTVRPMLIFIIERGVNLLWPMLLACLVLGVLSSFLQIGWLFTTKPLTPDLSKLDPIKGAAKFVSKRSFFETAKSLGKVILIGVVAYHTLWVRGDRFIALSGAPLPASVAFMAEVMFVILIKCCVLLIFIAVVDFLFTRWEMEQKMKMTKQEVKEEHKETEGNPQIKQKVRQIQREMAQKRMMADVPKADVIITNPTHYAVAIHYVRGEMDAPSVLAKGVDQVALRIREIGTESGIPLVENPPVARALYQVEIGDEIPEEMFKAVAEILVYVYSLKNGK